jgi:hypothetical protein
MVKEEEEESKELEIVMGNPFKDLESSLLRSLDHHKLLSRGFHSKKFKLTKVFTSSKDGFLNLKTTLATLKGPSLTLFKSHLDKVFGAFTSLSLGDVES